MGSGALLPSPRRLLHTDTNSCHLTSAEAGERSLSSRGACGATLTWQRSQLSSSVRWTVAHVQQRYPVPNKRLTLTAAAAALAIIVACQAEPHRTTLAITGARDIASLAHDSILPMGVLAPDVKLDSFVREWYGNTLKVMKEPRLGTFVDSTNVEAMRFLWLRSFDHPVALRAMRRGSAYTLIAVELSGAGGYPPGAVVRRDSLPLDSISWEELSRPLKSAGFWKSDTPEQKGLDGAEWVIEAASAGHLYLVDRWSPDTTGAGASIRRFGLAMLRHTSIPVGRVY